MAEIQIIAKESHQPLAKISGTSAKLHEPSIVLLKVSPQDISMLHREGTSVIVYLKNGEIIKIENFFSESQVTDNSLVLGAGTDQLIWARFTNDEGILLNIVQYQPLEKIDALLYSDAKSSNLLYWGGGAVALGAVAVAVGKNNSSDSSNNGNPGEIYKPAKPTDIKVANDGQTVTGKGEAGSKVLITNSKGKLIGSGVVDDKGNFEVKLDAPLTNGGDINVSIKDSNGNQSDGVKVTVPDTIKPDVPSIVKVSNDGKVVTGKGEPGATVIIKDINGKELATAKIDETGMFKVTLDTPIEEGSSIKVSIKDEAGNISDESIVKTPPGAPVVYFDGKVVSGSTEPGAKIEVMLKGELIGVTMADKNGQYSLTLHEPLSNGEKIEVVAIDKSGNKSKSSDMYAPDTTPPTLTVVEFAGTVFHGKTEPGAKVTIKTASGEEKTVTVGADGLVKVTLDTPVSLGESINISVTDKLGNTSQIIKVVAEKPPAEPEQPPVEPEQPPAEPEQPPAETVNTAVKQQSVQDLAPEKGNGNADVMTDMNLVNLFHVAEQEHLASKQDHVDESQVSADFSRLLNNVETSTQLDEVLQTLATSDKNQSSAAANRSNDPILKSEGLLIQEVKNPLQDFLYQQELHF